MKRRSFIIMLFTVCWMRSAGSQPPAAPASASDTVTPASWSLTIEAAVTGAHDSLASLGVRPDATSDYDPQYDIPRPPAPPGTSVQVYFPHDGGNWPTLLGNRFAVDRTDPQTPSWKLIVETNAGAVPLTMSWDAAAVAQLPGSYFLIMRDTTADSLINLRETGSYTFAYAEPRTFFIDAEFASTFIEIGAGWNILSLPRDVPDPAVDSLFPGHLSPAYAFDDGYTTNASLAHGAGYWLKMPSPGITVITGIGVDSLDIPLQQGWNLVGTIDATIPSPSGPGLVTPFYDYADGYRKADSLIPGRGYWIKAASAMNLSLGPGAFPATAPAYRDAGGPAASITVSSAQGGAMTLFVLDGDAATGVKAFDLPPVPPAPAFDARFASGGAATTAGGLAGARGESAIVIQDGGGPVRIAAERGSLASEIEVNTGPDQWEAITGKSEPVALSLGPGRTILRIRLQQAAEAPGTFALEGNYPNPFNPSTVIAYRLPESCLVSVTVTDPAGRSVFRGPAVREEAGRREYRFDPGRAGLAAGVYFYTLEARAVAGGSTLRASGKLVYLK